MAIRRKRKNVSKKSPARARRQKRSQRRELLLENLEDRRLLAGIPELAGIQTNDGQLLDDNEVVSIAPRELVFGFNRAAEIDPSTLGAIQVLQSGKDGTFNRATTTSDLNTGGAVEVLFTATSAGVVGNGTQVVFTKSDHGNASSPFVEVDLAARTVTLDLNTHSSNSTTALGIANAINGHTDASSLLTAEVTAGDPLVDVAAVEITYSPISLAGSNDVVIEPGYVGLGDSAREVVFRFKETLADETYQVVIDGSSPLALKDLDGSVFQDGEDFSLQFELELGAQIAAVVPQPVIRDSAGALDQLRDTIHVYFNDDTLDEALAEDPNFYQMIYTRTTVDANDDVLFSPVSVDYNAQSNLAVLTFSAPLTQLIDPVSGTEIKSGVFRLRIGTDEAAPPRPLSVDLLSDAGSSFDQAQSVGRNLIVSSAGDTFTDGQSFDIEDDQGVKRTFEFDTGGGGTLAAGAIAVPVTASDTPAEVATSIATAINGAGFDVRASRDGERITLVNARIVEHADLVISGDASTFLDGQTVQVVSDSGRIDVLEVETGFLLDVPGAGSDPATEITDTQTFIVSDGTASVTFEFDLQGNGVAAGNVAIGYAGGEDATDMAEKVVQAINGQSLGLTSQVLGAGGVHLGGTTAHTLDTASTAMGQSGQPGVGQGNVAVPVVPSAAITSDQVASGIIDTVNAAGLVGVSARLDGTRVFLDGVASVTSAGGIGGALLSAPVSIEQFRSIVLSGEIEAQSYPLAEAGSVDEPGHRDIRVQSHLNNEPDSTDGVTGPQLFSFPEQYGTDPQGNVLLNAITEEQKQRAREIFEIYGDQLGITFVEHDAPNGGESDQGFRIVTGDMRAIDPTLPIGVGGVLGVAGENMAIMDLQDFQQANDDRYGGPWFQTAMHEIGHLLGLGHTDELAAVTVMNDDPSLTPSGQTAEAVFPGDHDLVHGRQLFRPDSTDIDLYRVPIDSTGVLRIETFAERQQDSSLLDTVVTLYREVDGARELVARNDDYFSEDSRIELSLNAGTYFIGVSASGNDSYNPEIEDSGYGGKTQGRYDLQLTFRPDAHNAIEDLSGVALDGDGDGVSGGVFNFWFQTAIPAGVSSDLDDPRILFVDKLASGTENGALAFPFGTLGAALAEADPGDIIRMVGNPGADGDASTLSDNVSYQFGYNRINGAELEDGNALLVPQGVTVMIDAGAIVKSRRGRIGVGSSSPSIDRSGGALQILGTPHLVNSDGDMLLDGSGASIPGSVYMTSINDQDTGADSNPDQFPPAPRPGDWGGIDFRNDIDSDRNAPVLYSDQGVFLDYVNHAHIAYGGGVVLVDGTSEVVSPLHLSNSRPTITFNTIEQSAESAISANPDSFQETTFQEPGYQSIPFTSDYSRVGPAIHGNTIVDNSINGLFLRIATPAGNALESLTVAGRFDDTDIVHVVTENLQIEGTPGGPLLEVSTPPTTLVTLQAASGGSLGAGSYNYRIVYVDAAGNEGFASTPTRTLAISGGSIQLQNLPAATAGFVARRVYRSTSLGTGPYTQVAEINGTSSSYLDDGSTRGGTLVEIESSVRSRLDASLVVDPGTIIKLDGSRIETGVGTQLVVEGVDGREVIFTSLRDHRYGAGGTFDTSLQGQTGSAALGDWSGIFAGATSQVSIDHTLVAYGGGVSRIEGTFAGFNALEIHQADARITNSVFQFNADGSGGQAADRLGRGTNDQAVIFVRGAQPVILDNVIRDNLGELAVEQAAAISINVNSLSHVITPDPGRMTGVVDKFGLFEANQGPLIRLNRMDNNAVNGMVVRGGTLTTESVWDDTDIVHVVQDMIHVPDFHTYGGLRLQSSGSESLVVKLDGPVEVDEDTGEVLDEGAGFRADGRPLEIDDRIGGVIQIVGQPRHPVILTSINDNTVGAGFTPDGLPMQETIPTGSNVDPGDPPPTFPPGPEVDNGLLIDNDVDVDTVGHFEYRPIAGGSYPVGSAGQSGVTVEGRTTTATNADFIFDYINYVDVGSDGTAVDLSATTITQAPVLVSPDLVRSAGNFPGANGQVNWTMDSHFDNGEAILFNTLTLSGANEGALGDIRFITYLDEDVQGISDDILYLQGTPGEADFRAYTLDGPERFGFSQGGFYELGPELFNASYTGWAADEYNDLKTIIAGAGTTYTVPGNIDTADLPLFTDPDLDPVYGPADVTTAFAWNVDPAASTATIVSFLELVPQDPTTIPPVPQFGGDWNSIQLATFSHDRNIGVVVEREGITDQNKDPQIAQFVGALAPHEKAGDDNQRLGFQLHGEISQPNDMDVYSFEGHGGTEVWLDIDATSHSLDTVVELIDVDGNVLARSDNSIDEAADPSLLLDNNGEAGAYPLDKSAHEIADHWSTNPRDAGMRVVLPGAVGSVNTYHIRVRSSSGDLLDLDAGTSSGRYQLQVRLGELDELPGSTIQFADIRFATNAIEILGQPVHSPLSGEIAEVEAGNTAQQLGNLLATDRATFSIAGSMADAADVDLFEFGITYDQVQTGSDSGYAAMMDIDYADGLARANTSLNVFDAAGQLILIARDSNVAEDRPGPLNGIDMQDLSRGTVGPLDPLLGTVELPGGTTYQVAITTDSLVPAEMDQFITANPVNANLRLEPIPAMGRIVEDHINETIFSTFAPPQVPVIVGNDGIVPYHIGDVVLFISQDTGVDQTTVTTVDGFTGALETTVGTFNRDVGDIDIRGVDDRMYTFTLDLEDGNGPGDGQAGNYIQIDTGDGTLINPCDGTLQDDNVQTNHENIANPGNPIASNVGMHYDAMTYAAAGLVSPLEDGFVVGHRPKNAPTNQFVTGGTDNVLYRFDPECGDATSGPLGDRTGTALIEGAGTNIRERGILDTTVDSNGTGFSWILASEATEVAPDGTTTTLIADGTRFLIEDDGNLLTPAVEFEFNGGPEVYFGVDPANGIFVRDGDGFTLDGQPYEFNTGSVLVINAQNGSQLNDGDTISITDKNGQLKNFEFDSGNGVGPGSEKIDFTNGMSQPQLVSAIISAINGAANFEVQASTLSATSNRITLVDDSTTSNPSTTAINIDIQGAGGGTGGSGALIEIEETFNDSQFSDAMVTRFNQLPAITVSPDGARINFSGSLFGSFTEIINRGVFTDQQTDGLFGVTAVQVPFLASDTAEDIAQKMTTALNGQTIPSTQDVTVVRLDAPATVVPPIDSPLRIGGAAPGGDITGMAFIGNTLFAVSNDNDPDFGGGGLFVVNNPLGLVVSASLDYIDTSAPFLQGIDFQGLAAGPVATEDGLYQDILFGIDSAGELYAFNTDGVLQPLFVDGATSVQTGLANVTGLQFSTREENLWATTADRSADAGHGLLPSYDGVRTTVTPGGSSLHFGQGLGNDIDVPGGVHGSFETRTFSLENYSSADQPVLYFNYFAETEGATGAAMRDSFRIFVGDDSGQWDLLSTNNSDLLAELDLEPAEVQEAFDGVNQWRQVRADLSSYAGHANLRLRFDFSTAGEMNTGHQQTVGDELRTIPARDLRDGQVITIGNAGPDGRWGVAGVDDDNNDIVDDSSERLTLGSDDLSNLETFEIDLGYTLVAPSGAGIADAEVFTVDYGSGISADFEFDNDGSSSSANAVSFDVTMSAAEVARAVQTAILEGVQAPVQNGTINGTSEPNDVLSNAIPINLSGLSGRFVGTGGEIGDNPNLVTLPDADVDLLKIDLLTDTRMTIDIDSENYSNNVDLLNSFVRVFDSSGQELASNNAASAPGEQPGTDSYLEFSAPRDGTYYIGISGAGNTAYDPSLVESGAEGSTGSYDLEIQIQTSGGYVQRSNHRVQLPGAVDVTETSGLTLDGQPGITGDFAITLHAGMNQDAVADAVRRSLAGAYAGGNLDVIKGYDQVVRVIGHSVVDSGPLGLTFQMPGDLFGDFNSNERGQNNIVEGVYIDDIIVGFAERGEMVTGANANTAFVNNTRTEPNQVTSGPYQLELRGGSEYVGTDDDGNVILEKTFDTNDRLSQETTIVAPAGYDIADGQTFTLSDGLHELVFEYDDDNVDDGVPQGDVEISFNPDDSSATIAQRIRDAINGAAVQSILDIRAASSEGTVAGESGDNRVNLFGVVRTSLVDDRLDITDVTTDGNLLRDAILGSGVTVVGDATLVGSDVSAGVFEGGLSTIGLDGGIILSTGDVKFAEGPNVADDSSSLASQLGDLDLDAEFVTTTLDSTSLEFQFESTTGDIFFDFVFASEEYNEFVGSEFNDVFGFFVDGVNIALIPGASQPISINTVNGGNPLGTGASNPQFYINNDLDDGGQFLQQLGYDGFTTVFTAQKLGLSAGTHTIKLSIADVGDTILDSAVFIGADSFSDTTDVVLPTGIGGERFDLLGDENLHREQGQVLIHSNRISDALEFGIVVDASSRTGPDSILHQGPTRSLLELNTEQLVPGITITNNVLARNILGGIRFEGEVNVAGEQVSAVPFGRIVNNTIVGDGGGVGIQVGQNASSTILNNVVSNLETGIDIDDTSETTVLGGTLYAGNTTDFTNTNIGEGDFPLFVPGTQSIFVNATKSNFYPAEGSLLIDSSINSLEERASLNTVKAPLGIAPSPILAPDLDGAGQERVDDPSVATPSGLGQNVFKDRGAIDRADFSGPSAYLANPEDNDDLGVDRDSRVSIVEIRGVTTDIFEIQLVDGVVPIDSGDGIGIDDSTVTSGAVKVFQDDIRLVAGIDYTFNYDATNDVIRLSALAGAFQQDRTYRLELANVAGFLIEPEDGSAIRDGDTFLVTDSANLTVDFEFECGYIIEVPQAYTLIVPENGGGDIVDGETFVITDDQGNDYLFEMDRNGVIEEGNFAVPYTIANTAGTIADSLVSSLTAADIGLSPVNLGDGEVHVGTQEEYVLDTTNTAIDQAGVPASVLDGDIFTVDDGSTVVSFELDSDGSLASGGTGISFSGSDTHEQIADSISAAITGTGLNITLQHYGEGRVHVGGTGATQVDVTNSILQLLGQPGVRPGYGVRIPSQAGAPAGLVDGETFTISDGTTTTTFEFDNDQNATAGNAVVRFDNSNTIDSVANELVSAIQVVGLGLDPENVGNGIVEIGSDGNHVLNLVDSVLTQVGFPGIDAAVAVPFIPDESFDEGDVSESIATAINGSELTGVFAQARIDSVVVTGAQSISGTGIQIVIGTIDDTSEPNDRRSSATEIDLNGLSGHFVGTNGEIGDNVALVNAARDVDLLYIDLEANTTITIDIDTDAYSENTDQLDSYLRVFDNTGQELANNDNATAPGEFSNGDSYIKFTAPFDDTYFIGVSGMANIAYDSDVAGGGIDGSIGSYDIEVTVLSVSTTNVLGSNGIHDLAGNALTPNQTDGSSVLTVVLSSGLDYGDAPDPPYASNRDSNGATHEVVSGYHLGAGVNVETDAKSNANASGDTDDGVSFTSGLAVGFDSELTVTVAGVTANRAGILDAWIDFDHDGDWSLDERVISQPLVEGDNQISFTVPNTALVGDTFARFRLSSTGTSIPEGPAIDGEVEDYQVTIGGNPWRNNSRPLDVNNDTHVSPIDALQIITALNDGKAGLLPVPPTVDFSPPPFLDVNGDGHLSPLDALLVIDELNSQSSGEGEGEAEGEPAGWEAPLASTLTSEHLVMAEASYIPRLSDFIPRRQSSLVMPASDASADVEVDSRRVDQSPSGAVEPLAGADSDDLDDVLQLIGEDLSDIRESDAHDEYFARLRF